MGIKIKQIDGLQQALDNAGGGKPYYLSSFSMTGAESDNGPESFETEIEMHEFGLYDPDFLVKGHNADGYITVNGILANETYYNNSSKKVSFITDYPVDTDDVIQYVVLWDAESGE